MKHRSILILLILLSLPREAMTRRLSLSPFMGINLSTFSIALESDEYDISPSILPCPVLGMCLQFQFTDHFALQTAPAYIKKGTHVRTGWVQNTIPMTMKQTYCVQYIAVPLRIRYTRATNLPYLLAGTGIGFKLDDMDFTINEYIMNGRNVVGTINYAPKIKTADIDFTLDLGIGVRFKIWQSDWFAEALYQHGLNDIYNDVSKDKGSFRTRGVLITAGINLCL